MADDNVPAAPPATKAAAPAQPVERVAIEDYTPTGNILVKAKVGYTVAPHDMGLPIVTETGVRMSEKQAIEVVAAYEEYISSVEEIKE